MLRQCVLVVVLLAGLYCSPWARADVMLMDTYIVTPLPGQRGPLEQAINDHINHRLANGESRGWQIYTPTLGPNIGRFLLFHCCLNWEELERYQNWELEQETMSHWMTFVEPFVQQLDHFISEVDIDNSNWESYSVASPFLNVTELHIRAGHREQAMEDVSAISNYVKAMNWLPNWMWSWQLGGDPVLNLVIPQERISDMSARLPGFEHALGEHLGDKAKATALLENWNGHFEDSSFQLFRLLRHAEPKREE